MAHKLKAGMLVPSGLSLKPIRLGIDTVHVLFIAIPPSAL
jgi:hypothetical protein